MLRVLNSILFLDHAEIADEPSDKLNVDKPNDAGRQSTTKAKNLETVVEGDKTEFSSSYELNDEEAWVSRTIWTRIKWQNLSKAKVVELLKNWEVCFQY